MIKDKYTKIEKAIRFSQRSVNLIPNRKNSKRKVDTIAQGIADLKWKPPANFRSKINGIINRIPSNGMLRGKLSRTTNESGAIVNKNE